MSNYLLPKFTSVLAIVLKRHSLVVPQDLLDSLAKIVMHCRVLPSRAKGGSYSPLPALKKATIHAAALLKYSTKRASHPTSIPTHCTKLSAALRDEHAAMNVGLAAPDFDQAELLNALAERRIDVESLARLLEIIDAIKFERKKDSLVGAPRLVQKTIVHCGYIAWKMTGRGPSYSMRDGTLRGRFPAFLREVISCCDGTHPLVAKIDRDLRPTPPHDYHSEGKLFTWPRVRGDRLRFSDSTLHGLIAECKDDKAIVNYLSMRKKV